jgi:pSer/pThr/pTyr-binding forkhead associated (FHA) protein
MPVQLIGLTEGLKIVVDKPILLLGRDPECDIQFDSRKISRRHCCIAQVRDQLVVRDLGSTNGIRVNGVRVVEGYLKAGDELTVGNHRYVVRWDASSAELPRSLGNEVAPRREPVPAARDSQGKDELLESSEEPIPLIDADDILSPTPYDGKVAEMPVEKIPSRQSDDSPIPGLGDHEEFSLAPISEDFPSISPRGAPGKPPQDS